MYAGNYEQADLLLQGESESGPPFPGSGGRALWYRGISYRNQGRLNEALADGRRFRAQALQTYPARVVVTRRALPIEAVLEGQTLWEMGRFRQAAAVFDSVARWVVGDEWPSQNAHARAWALTHALGARIDGGDTLGIEAWIDTVATQGAQTGNGRDRLLHHHLRGMLLAARGQDDLAVAELRRAVYSWSVGYTRTNVVLAQALLRRGRPQEAVAALQPALHGWVEASNFYLTRTEIHELLGRAWEAVGGSAARDSAIAHYGQVVRAWNRADSSFAPRLRQAQSRLAALSPATR
jgi:tetratricopeptide (TPR) repeat protein